MPLAAGSRLGPYEILAPLGVGGMGEVYRARDTRLGREVAVKVLPEAFFGHPERVKRFEKEARAASALNHPNIVTIYDIGSSNAISYIAMELVEGTTLRELLTDGALPVRKLLAIGAQVAEGLAKAHESGIVHRDLKPENVMVTKDGFAKILDFGLAKLTQPEDSGPATQAPTVSGGTEPGIVVGTVAYMSPEQALGKALDFRSDQFSFGSMLYEMATGKKAFARASGPETMTAIIREEAPAIGPSIPVALRWILDRCLAKDSEERYAATRDLARDFARFKDGISQTSGQSAAPATISTRWKWLLPAGIALAAGLGLALVLSRPHEAELPVYRALTFRRGTLHGARFAPDGQTVVYAAAWQGGRLQLFSTRTDSTEYTTLPHPGADLLSISSSGKLALLDRSDLFRTTLSEAALAGGAARPTLEGDIEAADWAPGGEGDRLAVAREGRLEFPVGKVLYDPGPGKSIRSPRFSPDGKSIAFIEELGGLNAISVVDLAGHKRVLSKGWESTPSLAWHPSTREIWFSAREVAGFGVINLHAISMSGRHRVVARGPLLLILEDIAPDGRVLLRSDDWPTVMMCLPPGASQEVDLTWLDFSLGRDLSDDGRTLLFEERGGGAGAKGAVFIRKTDGAAAVRLGEGDAESLSPDQKWVLSGRREGLVLLPTGAGQPRTLATPGLEVEGTWAVFFLDGRRILFTGNAPGHDPRVFVQDLVGGAPRPITPEGFVSHIVSPDGTVAVCRRVKDRKAYLFPVEGGEPRLLAGIASDDGIARFDAKGESLFLISLFFPLRIERYDVASGRREPWKTIELTDPAGVAGIEGVQLTPDGKSYAYTFMRRLSRLYVVEGLK